MQRSNLLCILFSVIAFDVLSCVYSASTMLPRAIETTDVDEAVESETIIKSRAGMTNIPLDVTAKALVKDSTDDDLERANEGETTDDDDDLASAIHKGKVTPMPKGEEETTDDNDDDLARAIDKGKVTPMPKGKGSSMPEGMTKAAGRKLGATKCDDDDDCEDDDDKNDYAETMEPMQAVSKSRKGEMPMTPMPKGRNSDVPKIGEVTDMPLDEEVTEDDEDDYLRKSKNVSNGAARLATDENIILPATVTVAPRKIAAGSGPTLPPLEALYSKP